MNLKHLLSCLSLSPEAIPDAEITEITENSACADRNSLFVCICGFRADGHAYAPDAYRNGCRYFVAEHPLSLPADAFIFQVSDTHSALGKLANILFGEPSRRIRLIGITGTKGKTTTACFIREILRQNGVSAGYIGTNGIFCNTTERPTQNTTPDAVTLQKTLREMADAGCNAAVLEVSSQALMLQRTAGLSFDICLFTNLSPDHIGPGEHADFADYIDCKRRLFTEYAPKTVIYNADDPYADKMLQNCSAGSRIPCSVSGIDSAGYAALEIAPACNVTSPGTAFVLRANGKNIPCTMPLIGSGNVSNALLAIACAGCFGISPTSAIRVLSDIRIRGRSEIIPLPNGGTAVIDYAHNGVSLRQLLTELRAYRPHRLICLFGSVGERTVLRRQELGSAAAEVADFCILTSDNPGKEPPEQIISDIAQAFRDSSTPYLCIPDRAEAIRTAVQMTSVGDILVLAGKGHETYQLIGNEKVYFSEREILREICNTHLTEKKTDENSSSQIATV